MNLRVKPPAPADAAQMSGGPCAETAASPESLDSLDHTWFHVCALEDIPRLGARVVRRRGEPNVAVFRTADDRLFALADRCPHRGGPLSQGIVFGERVACPLHNTCIDLHSGCAVAPDQGHVQSYGVRMVAGAVYVDFGASARDELAPRAA